MGGRHGSWRVAAILGTCVAAPSWAGIAFVQASGNNCFGSPVSTVAVALPAATSAGDTGIVIVVQTGGTPLSSGDVTDDAPGGGSPWGVVTSVISASNQDVELWSTPPGGLVGGASTVTVTIPGASVLMNVEFGEYSGALALGHTAASADGGSVSALAFTGVMTQDPDNWVVAGFGAHGQNPFAPLSGTLRDQESTLSKPAGTIRFSALVDTFAAQAGQVPVLAVTLDAGEPWTAVAVELRTVVGAVDAGGGDGGSADAGPPADGGTSDGGTAAPDAGGADAGRGNSGGGDGGVSAQRLGVGCGASADGALALLGGLAAALFLRRRPVF